VVGAVAGGATLGLGAAALAAVVRAADPSDGVVVASVVASAAIAALVDAGAFGRRPPFFRRQVDDAWLSRYRAWVYGVGFGWQIGVGLATYIMTAAVVLTVLLAALTASPATAFAICVAFGLARGLVVLLGSGLRSPAALGTMHERLDALEAPVRWGVTGLQALVALVVGVGAIGTGGLAGLALAAAVAGVATLVRLPRGRRSAHPSPA
jgi:hypothetical protein